MKTRNGRKRALPPDSDDDSISSLDPETFECCDEKQDRELHKALFKVMTDLAEENESAYHADAYVWLEAGADPVVVAHCLHDLVLQLLRDIKHDCERWRLELLRAEQYREGEGWEEKTWAGWEKYEPCQHNAGLKEKFFHDMLTKNLDKLADKYRELYPSVHLYTRGVKAMQAEDSGTSDDKRAYVRKGLDWILDNWADFTVGGLRQELAKICRADDSEGGYSRKHLAGFKKEDRLPPKQRAARSRAKRAKR